ncbi:MAG: nitroreductase family protein [Rhabdochlamydiaceae bacterium]
MQTSEAISQVMTVREYDQSKKAPLDVIKKIVDAGRLTPSAKNQQPWSFIVITDAEALKKIASLSKTGPHIANAAFAVVVVTNPENRWHEIDGTRAIQSMTIQAWTLGLGNSWVGTIERDQIKEMLHVPKNLNILTVLPFGYPIKKYRGKKNRKQFDEVVFLNSYGTKFGG